MRFLFTRLEPGRRSSRNQNAIRGTELVRALFTVVRPRVILYRYLRLHRYILPATTFLEDTEIRVPKPSTSCSFPQRAESSRQARRVRTFGSSGDSGSVWDFRSLASGHAGRRSSSRRLQIGPDRHSADRGMDRRLRGAPRSGPHSAQLPPRAGYEPLDNTSAPLPTPSGKIEFYSESLAASGMDPLRGTPPTESRWSERRQTISAGVAASESRQLHELNLRQPRRAPEWRRAPGTPSKSTPSTPGIANVADGDPVRIFNDRGSSLTTLINPSLPAGVVADASDWAKFHADGFEFERPGQ